MAACNERKKSDGRYEAQKAAARARYQPTRYELTCKYCGEAFVHRRSNARYCSSLCASRYFNKARNEDGRLREQRVKLRDKRREWARKDRATKGSNRKRYPAAALKSDSKRRLRTTSTKLEDFTRTEIFERDGWRCQLCHRKVDKRLAYPNPRSASLDHIVPLAEGGEHTRTNVQLAHLGCNLDKGTRPRGEQLILLG